MQRGQNDRPASTPAAIIPYHPTTPATITKISQVTQLEVGEEEGMVEVVIDAEENLIFAGVQRAKELIPIKRSTTAADLCQLVQVPTSLHDSFFLLGHALTEEICGRGRWRKIQTPLSLISSSSAKHSVSLPLRNRTVMGSIRRLHFRVPLAPRLQSPASPSPLHLAPLHPAPLHLAPSAKSTHCVRMNWYGSGERETRSSPLCLCSRVCLLVRRQ